MGRVWGHLVSRRLTHRLPVHKVLLCGKLFVLWSFEGIVFVSSIIFTWGRGDNNKEMDAQRSSRNGRIWGAGHTFKPKVVCYLQTLLWRLGLPNTLETQTPQKQNVTNEG